MAIAAGKGKTALRSRHGWRFALLAAALIVVASGSTAGADRSPSAGSSPISAAATGASRAASPSASASAPASASPPAPTATAPLSAYPTGSLPMSVDMAPLVTHGSRAYKQIAITIDDCSSGDAVQNDLAFLQQYRVNVTWFPIGWVAARMPSIWRRVDAAGFPIANHTYSHKNLALMSFSQVVRDIQRDNEVMASILGHPIMPLVRPYGGWANATTFRAAAAAGERAVVNWDTVGGDASGNWRDVSQIITLSKRAWNGSILLLHANSPYTTRALPAIVANFRSRGFELVTLGQLLGIDGPVPYPGMGPIPPVQSTPTNAHPSSGPTSAPSATDSAAVTPDQVVVDAAGPARDDRLGWA